MERLPQQRSIRAAVAQSKIPLGSDVPAAHQMISEIEIENFKCFEHLKISDCKRINVIVGDNGAGKTALLEGIFLALGMTSELPIRYP
jgi:predicted ATPase